MSFNFDPNDRSKQQLTAEGERVARAQEVREPTCVTCGRGLGKSLQAWLLGACSGECAERRMITEGKSAAQYHMDILFEAHRRLLPFWKGNG